LEKFISISVNQGDAFYLEREERKILVDGGKSRNGFPQQFLRTTNSESIDILVCTHADADHINGLLGLLDQGFSIAEVWLPGAWTSRLEDLINRPDKFIFEAGIEIMEKDHGDESNLEEIDESTNPDCIENVTPDEPCIEISKIYSAIETQEKNNEWKYRFSFEPLFYHQIHKMLGRDRDRDIYIDAIKTAEKIREMAILAYHSGAKIRWFEFGQKPTKNCGEKYLRPINSRETFQISKRKSALEYLSLSKANKESLVFHSPTENGRANVLFSADSDLAFNSNLQKVGADSIITAPHHGSEHNKNAYQELTNNNVITNESILIRSDGKYKSRPGNSYLQSVAKRACTLCRPYITPKQNVIFESNGKGWLASKDLNWCKCK
jgi:beta-lactamase superfamily II metal-dependent hydrolase|tara:strand:+ start:4371 stop:5510 length:1140 start_codon:yes stop_codon:yes gene_type:complete